MGGWLRNCLFTLVQQKVSTPCLIPHTSPIAFILNFGQFLLSILFACSPCYCWDFAELYHHNARLALQNIRIQRLGITFFLVLRFHGSRLKPFYDCSWNEYLTTPTSRNRSNNHDYRNWLLLFVVLSHCRWAFAS
jgi:hypothetical protein